jgi:hypothetical protein
VGGIAGNGVQQLLVFMLGDKGLGCFGVRMQGANGVQAAGGGVSGLSATAHRTKVTPMRCSDSRESGDRRSRRSAMARA